MSQVITSKELQMHVKKGNVQETLEILHKKVGKKFFLIWKTHKIPLALEMSTVFTKKTKAYVLYWDIPQLALKPLTIWFFDPVLYRKNNSTYISSIHSTESMSGTETVKLVLDIQKDLGVEKTYLYDGAHIYCDKFRVDLSFMKMLEKGLTFYMKAGFEFAMETSQEWYLHFDSQKDLKDYVKQSLEKLHRLEVKKVIQDFEKCLGWIHEHILAGQRDGNITFVNHSTNPSFVEESEATIWIEGKRLPELVDYYRECAALVYVLRRSQDKYLVSYILNLFRKNNCNDSEVIRMMLFDKVPSRIVFKNKVIDLWYIQLFAMIKSIRANFLMSFTF
jgi:hypothetical protein